MMQVIILILFLNSVCCFPQLSQLPSKFEPCSAKGEAGVCKWVNECPEAADQIVTSFLRTSASCNPFSKEPLVCCINKGLSFPDFNIPVPKDQIDLKTKKRPVNPSLQIVSKTSTILEPDYDTINPNPERLCRGNLCSLNPNLPFYNVEGNEETLFCSYGVGGRDANPSSWPWAAMLGYDTSEGLRWSCDASLINSQWVITAAHCFDTSLPVAVRLGEIDYTNDTDGAFPEDFGITKIVVHPQYARPVAYHDIALVKLDRPVNISEERRDIKPVCLPWDEEINSKIVNRTVALTGWGATEFGGELSPVLQEVFMSVFDSQVCDRSYSDLHFYEQVFPDKIKTENLVCAGHVDGGRDACSGDSGGPLVYYSIKEGPVLTGIVAKGNGCGSKEFPGLYTPLHRPDYLTWIKRTAFQVEEGNIKTVF